MSVALRVLVQRQMQIGCTVGLRIDEVRAPDFDRQSEPLHVGTQRDSVQPRSDVAIPEPRRIARAERLAVETDLGKCGNFGYGTPLCSQ